MLDLLADLQSAQQRTLPVEAALEEFGRRERFVDEERRQRHDVRSVVDAQQRAQGLLRHLQLLDRRLHSAAGFVAVHLEDQPFGAGEHAGLLELAGVAVVQFEGFEGPAFHLDDFAAQPDAVVGLDQQDALCGVGLPAGLLGDGHHRPADPVAVDALAAREEGVERHGVDRGDVGRRHRHAERAAPEPVEQRRDELFAGNGRLDEILERSGEGREPLLHLDRVGHADVGAGGRDLRIPVGVEPAAFGFGLFDLLRGDAHGAGRVGHLQGLFERQG